MQHVAIIIPCYNEERRIHASLLRLDKFFSNCTDRITVVVVDDGSTDGTVHNVSEYNASSYKLQLVSQKENQGKGAAIQVGVASIEADVYGFMDADLAIDFEDIFLDTLELLKHADIVVGERAQDKSAYSVLRRMASTSVNWCVHRLLGITANDVQCGYKWFTKKVTPLVAKIEDHRFSFDTSLLMHAAKEGFSVTSIPVTWTHTNEDSSVRMQDGVRYLIDIFRLLDIRYSFQHFARWYVFGASVVTFALFGWTLSSGYFFSDDFTWLWHGSRIASGELGVLTAHMSSFYSPVLNSFYATLYSLVGFTPSVYYLFGLLAHIATSTILGSFVHRITKSGTTGLFAAILFASVGSAFEPLVWIGSNMHSFAALFILLTIYLQYRGMGTKKPLWYLGSLITFVLALFTKEISIVALPFIFFLPVAQFVRLRLKDFTPVWYYGTILIVSALYLYKQFLAQINSVWVQGGTYVLAPSQLLRLPTSLFDVFVPLGSIITSENAIALAVISLAVFGYFIYRFWRVPFFLYAMMWFVVASLPVIFFAAPEWWTTLASRYTYTMRIGFVLAIALMLHTLLKQRQQVRVIQGLFLLLLASFGLHAAVTMHQVEAEYSYVYASGRTLVQAVESLPPEVETLQVDYMRPFTNNIAHVVGTVTLLTKLQESDIIFLSNGESADATQTAPVLIWNETDRTYTIRYE